MNQFSIYLAIAICLLSSAAHARLDKFESKSTSSKIATSIQGEHTNSNRPINATITIQRLSSDDWIVHYQFSEPIDMLHFGPPVVKYRSDAWRVKTPGLHIKSNTEEEILFKPNGQFSEAIIAITSYHPFSHNQYVPMIHFSDQGVALFLGHLTGEVKAAGETRPLAIRFEASGRHGEKIILPKKAQENGNIFAYFGPQEPISTSHGDLILDPQTPVWMREMMADTVKQVTASYAESFGGAPAENVTIFLALRDLHLNGYSLSGGALSGQIAYRLAGNQSIQNTPESRQRFIYLMAHELAHIWQFELNRLWKTSPESWIIEGGAEAISLTILAKTGLWSTQEVSKFKADLIKECGQSDNPIRIAYACGFKRFNDYGVDPLTLWGKLINESKKDGLPYSEAMIQKLLEEQSVLR